MRRVVCIWVLSFALCTQSFAQSEDDVDADSSANPVVAPEGTCPSLRLPDGFLLNGTIAILAGQDSGDTLDLTWIRDPVRKVDTIQVKRLGSPEVLQLVFQGSIRDWMLEPPGAHRRLADHHLRESLFHTSLTLEDLALLAGSRKSTCRSDGSYTPRLSPRYRSIVLRSETGNGLPDSVLLVPWGRKPSSVLIIEQARNLEDGWLPVSASFHGPDSDWVWNAKELSVRNRVVAPSRFLEKDIPGL